MCDLRLDVGCHHQATIMAWEGNQLTLRRLEAPVQKFVKVALPTDLERLQKHHYNILKVEERERERERERDSL